MKKYLPYILAVMVLAAVAILFAMDKQSSGKKKKKLDERVTLRRQDKIPYGTYVAYKELHYLFPDASVFASKEEPGSWDSLSSFETRQAYIVVADNFSADEDEMNRIVRFAKKGNDVFISAKAVSSTVTDLLGCRVVDMSDPIFTEEDGVVTVSDDSLKLKLLSPYFESDTLFSYPGKNYSSSFTRVDQDITHVIGEEKSVSNFIHIRAGKGNLYLHLAPLAFSNYFLLHKDNIRYYEMVMSVINPKVKRILWDEYFISKASGRDKNDRKKGWFGKLMSTKNDDGRKPFQAAFWVLILLMLLYVLMEMRRKQRYIPAYTSPRNDSLEFVKTIGRLYYDKGDHRNLCRKMGSFFQEYVRTKYKLPTSRMDEDFIKALQFKSGVPDYEIRSIISFMKYVDETPAVSDRQLMEFYNELESFYKKA